MKEIKIKFRFEEKSGNLTFGLSKGKTKKGYFGSKASYIPKKDSNFYMKIHRRMLAIHIAKFEFKKKKLKIH